MSLPNQSPPDIENAESQTISDDSKENQEHAVEEVVAEAVDESRTVPQDNMKRNLSRSSDGAGNDNRNSWYGNEAADPEDAEDKGLLETDEANETKTRVQPEDVRKNAQNSDARRSDAGNSAPQTRSAKQTKNESPKTPSHPRPKSNSKSLGDSAAAWIRKYRKNMNSVLAMFKSDGNFNAHSSYGRTSKKTNRFEKGTNFNKQPSGKAETQQPESTQPGEQGDEDAEYEELLDRDSALICALVDIIFGVFGFMVILGCFSFWFGISAVVCACRKKRNIPMALLLSKIGMIFIPITLIAFIVLALTMNGLLLQGKAWIASFFTGAPGPEAGGGG